MALGFERNAEALRKTTSLIDYLADLTDAANRDPVRDITSGATRAPEPVLWLDEFPTGITLDVGADEVLLKMPPVPTSPPPPLPAELVGRVDGDLRSPEAGEPTLRQPTPEETEPLPESLQRVFADWLISWRTWAREEPGRKQRRSFYEDLETAAKKIASQDDEFEFVLAVALVSWRAPNGEAIRRHLLTEQVVPALDRTGVVTLTRLAGKRRMEDRELFEGQPGYRADRGRAVKNEILGADSPLVSDDTMVTIKNWLGLTLDTPYEERATRPGPLPGMLVLAPAPALLLRPRSRVQLAETYRRIAEALRVSSAQVPVALAQLVVDTEREERDQWLAEQGAASGDLLGNDPLFPLPANAEQSRVIELLRTETGVVVQGPPGTGKTHTIANLISALLARGQRVLVTSQKDQALRVLREKIPPELRKLCVLLAGGSKDAAIELQQGLDALSAAIASTDERSLAVQAGQYAAERERLQSASEVLNEQVRALRSVELLTHDSVVPGYRMDAYRGTLAQIVQQVQREAEDHNWMPALPVGEHVQDVPPLSPDDLAELRRLLADRTPSRESRAEQDIPDPSELPSAGELAERVQAEHAARKQVEHNDSAAARYLAELGADRLTQLERLTQQAWQALNACGLTEGAVAAHRQWIQRAAHDRLAGQNSGLWAQLLEVRDEPGRLGQHLQRQGVGFEIEFREPITTANLGTARSWLRVGAPLLDHFRGGGKLRRRMQSRPQRDAQPLLEAVVVDGGPPETAGQLEAVLQRIEAEVAAMQLARTWWDVDVPIRSTGVRQVLSELADNARALDAVTQLGEVHDAVSELLGTSAIRLPMASVESFLEVLAAIPAARQHIELECATREVRAVQATVSEWASRPGSCPEIGVLLTAVANRDLDQYGTGLVALHSARAEQQAERRCLGLARTLRNVHPELLALLERTAGDPAWLDRDVTAAWAWSRAQQFVTRHRNAAEERRLVHEFETVEDQLRVTTERLVALEATRQCLRRMTDDHQRALNTYRAHMSRIGAGTGKKTSEFRRAARAAMAKARDAVPAWVVPLPNLLDNIVADRDRFDVVIVDEASQVGVEHLYLLWMAPRVIVVGDEKQCTPGASALGQLDTVFLRNNEYLADIDPDIRHNLTSKSNLYEILSARSGRGALIRLREHFRCVPEIINWSSDQFYADGSGGSGLIPLRERTGDGLPPLKVTKVNGAVIEGRDARRMNAIEARAIVDQLVACLRDPAYEGKSFGVVVLQSGATRHIQRIEHLINEFVPPEQQQERKIQVGTAPNFQGAERDVIFLSMMVTGTPAKVTALNYRQAYNVAASRAKDQMWLFTSVGIEQLKPDDLRASLLGYLLDPPSVFGPSPLLDDVSDARPTPPFGSLFEQRVFREIRGRGYHVVPQYPVGSRTLDLVVAGHGGRIAVECDGHYWHADIDGQISDARRDRELARMGWQTVRIRESEFAFDPDRELAALWVTLADKGIKPGDTAETTNGTWAPVSLDDEQDDEEES